MYIIVHIYICIYNFEEVTDTTANQLVDNDEKKPFDLGIALFLENLK